MVGDYLYHTSMSNLLRGQFSEFDAAKFFDRVETPPANRGGLAAPAMRGVAVWLLATLSGAALSAGTKLVNTAEQTLCSISPTTCTRLCARGVCKGRTANFEGWGAHPGHAH